MFNLQLQSSADSLTKLLLQRMLLRRCSLWFQSLRLAAVRWNGLSARTGRGWLSARDDLTLLFSVQRGSSPRLGRMWCCLPWLGCCPWRWWQSTHTNVVATSRAWWFHLLHYALSSTVPPRVPLHCIEHATRACPPSWETVSYAFLCMENVLAIWA